MSKRYKAAIQYAMEIWANDNGEEAMLFLELWSTGIATRKDFPDAPDFVFEGVPKEITYCIVTGDDPDGDCRSFLFPLMEDEDVRVAYDWGKKYPLEDIEVEPLQGAREVFRLVCL